MESGSRRFLLIFGIVAAAAGAAAATYFYYNRSRGGETPPLRNVSEVLADCYDRMREIQRNLASMHPPGAQAPNPSPS